MKANHIDRPREQFSNINDEHLKEKISEIHQRYPRSGYLEITALLKTEEVPLIVQRERVRKLLAEVDPEGTSSRWTLTVKKRVYRVPTSNFLWHLDSNHNLIRLDV